MEPNNLIAVLQKKRAITDKGMTLITGNNQVTFISYHQLYQRSLKRLSFLQKKGLTEKDELVFQLEDLQTFVVTFWACILGGIIPVPLSIGQNDEQRQKIFNVWSVLRNPYLIASQDTLDKVVAHGSARQYDDLVNRISQKVIIETNDMAGDDAVAVLYKARETDVAFIQFSSGSTGMPKGVIVTHKNLITNLRAISKAAKYTTDDSMLSWMPLTHDMGLIGFHLNPLFVGMNHFLIPTHVFIRRPALWMEKASDFKVSILCAPNFGFWYLLKYGGMSEVKNWDLSSVRVLYNGAEPISWNLCKQFVESLAAYGLNRRSMRPVYGLAEATLAVTISNMNDEVNVLHLKRNRLNPGNSIQPVADPHDSGTLTFVNVGTPVQDCRICVTNTQNQALEDGRIGYLRIKGDNVTSGYYNNAAATRETLNDDGWLNTGDIGFIYEGGLYITGRAKDIIFQNGQNYYPHDFERVAGELPGIELNKIVFTGFFNPETHRDEIICFLLYKGDEENFYILAETLKNHVNARMGVAPDRVIAVKSIPKTTSGKLQRFKLLEKFRQGGFSTTDGPAIQFSTGMAESPPAPAASSSGIGERILQLWRSVLGLEKISVDDKFSDVGGNSLKAAAVAMLIWREFEVDVTLETIFEMTAKELAARLTFEKKHTYAPIPVTPEARTYPLAESQKRLFYAWSANPSSTAYNNAVAFRLEGERDVDRLRQCFIKLIERHDSLRMSFLPDAAPSFILHDSIDFELRVVHHSGEQLTDLLRKNVQPFDLGTPPLFRCVLLVSDRDEWVLFMDFHHIIADGISIFNLIGDLLDLYGGEMMQALPVQFKDFVRWEKQERLSENMREQEAYWLDKVSRFETRPAWSLDFVRPPVFDTKGEKFEFRLGTETIGLLNSIAAGCGSTRHSVLFTFYSILISKYTGQGNVVIGIPVSGRRHPDMQKLVGMFVNNLAIDCEINGNESFIECLQNTRRNLMQSLGYGDYPFASLVDAVAGKGGADRNPVFDTMFVYHTMEMPVFANANLSLTPYFFDPGSSKFDLSMEVFESGDSLRCFIEYASALFKKETMMRLCEHFENLIRSVKGNYQVRISDMRLTGEREFQECVYACNATDSLYPHKEQIHNLFERQVITSPDNVAIEFNGAHYSYNWLDDRAEALAGILREKGVGVGAAVAIMMRRSPEFIVAVLAVLKASACFVPIDVSLPKQKIERILQVSVCRLVIVIEAFYELLQYMGNDTVRAGEFYLVNLPAREAPLTIGGQQAYADPERLAYILFTSGTTGEPKGVMITHRSLVNYVWWAKDTYLSGENPVFPFFTSVSFDLTLTSLFVPLVTGNRILIYGENESESVIDRLVYENKAGIVKLTPSHLRLLKNSIEADMAFRSSIKTFIVGGEELESSLAAEVYERFHGEVTIFNEYGPTEATIGCMIYTFDPACTLSTVPIGVPISNTQVYLLDRFLKPVPNGMCGEIYVSGDGVFKGYLFNEALTAEKCVPSPFVVGKTLYKTGDLGKRLPDGNLLFMGRIDNQVKIQGYRIELGEIETRLMQFEGVDEVHVVKRKNEQDVAYLCAYYRGRAPIREADFRNYLASRLPYYMIPLRFIRTELFPLTIGGKIDLERLPPAEASQSDGEILPGNEIEVKMLAVWRQLFDRTGVTMTDNFYDLGGDSIKATQIVSKLIAMGIQVKVRDILTYHTIEQIAQHAVLMHDSNIYEQGVVSGAFQLTPMAAWFFSRKFHNPHYYNQSLLLRVNRKVDVRLLTQAFQEVIRKHDGLRINYDPANNVLFYNEEHLRDEFTITEYPPAAWSKHGELNSEAIRAIESGFDITKDLLINAAFFHDEEFGRLFITVHHLAMDGVSFRILLSDIYDLYYALETCSRYTFPEKTASLLQWTDRLATYTASESVEAEDTYWKDIGRVRFELPVELETDDWTYRHVSRVSGVLNRQQTEFLLTAAHAVYGTDVQILLIMALIRALKEWTGQTVFIIELENHGRHLPDIDVSRTIGWFTAMFPAKFELRDDDPGNQIKQVKEQFRKIPGHGLGFGICNNENGSWHNEGNRLSEVRFNYLGQFGRELRNSLFSLTGEGSGNTMDPANALTTRFDINAMVFDGQLILEIGYNTKAYVRATVERLHARMLDHLNEILDHLAHEKEVYLTPSDFDAVDLSEEELNALFE